VRKKGFHPELESVCRDLWHLRVREFPGLTREDGVKGKGGRRRSGGGEASDSEVGGVSGMAMFSSQLSAEESQTSADESFILGGARKSRSWAGEIWPLPGAMDTLAMVYLGCVLRQEPVRIGDVFRWARNNQMPFLGAVSLPHWGGLA
jgi:RNA polymerase I-specific transcription initiation factor RRN7